MEATGRDGGAGGPSWRSYRHHEETQSSSYTISSSSGTIVSTAHTYSSSRLSSSISMEAALLQLEFQTDKKDGEFVQPSKKPRKETGETLREKKTKHIESLVQEFLAGSSGRGGMNAVERWFSELGVRWVLLLNVADYASSASSVHGHPTIDEDEIWSWILALASIMETIRLTAASFFPDHGHGFVGMPGIGEEEVVESGRKQATTSLDPVHFALFFQEAMSKMFVFVDVMFSKSLSIRGPQDNSISLISCLDVYGALSGALSGIRLQFHSPPSAEIEKIEKGMVSLLSAKQGKAFEAIWSALEENTTRALKSMEEYSSGTQSQSAQGSSDIHEATCSVMDHIKFLLGNYLTVDPIVSQAARLGKYVPQSGLGEAPPFISMIAEIVSCLIEKLITKSQLFLDQGLGLLFLLNNSNFIREHLKYTFTYIKVDVPAVITHKVEHYIESYIQVSWEPMLACLFNPTPLRLVRKYSPLSKFESKFQKTYTTQKMWKVPDPMLRKRLRKAVIGKIIPVYTKYIKDSKVTNTKFTPQELEEMLQEMFEG